jgi:hypothetical protein
MIAGEYGDKKGRSHWHGVIFWLKRVPPIEVWDKRFMHQRMDEETGEFAVLQDGSPAYWWPHGWSQWGKITSDGGNMYASLRYVSYYVQKTIGDANRQSHFACSRKPALGAAYFTDLAQRYAQQAVSPQGEGEERTGPFTYTFPEAKRRDGSPVLFHLRDTTKALFLDAFFDEWRRLHFKPDWARFPVGPHECSNEDVLAGESLHGSIKRPPRSKLLSEHVDPYAFKETPERRAEK